MIVGESGLRLTRVLPTFQTYNLDANVKIANELRPIQAVQRTVILCQPSIAVGLTDESPFYDAPAMHPMVPPEMHRKRQIIAAEASDSRLQLIPQIGNLVPSWQITLIT